MQKLSNNLEIQKSFINQFENEVIPLLKAFEVLRIKINKKYKKILFAILAVALLTIALIIYYINIKGINDTVSIYSICLYPVIIPLLIIITLTFKEKENKKFIIHLKKTCLDKLLMSFGNMHWSNNSNKISDTKLNQSGLFATFNTRITDDEFTGNYKGINFKTSETNLIYKSGSGKNRTYLLVFKGIVLEFESKKLFDSKTIVSTKGDLTARDNVWIGIITPLITLIYMFEKCEPKQLLFFFVVYMIIAGAIHLYIKNKFKTTKKMEKIILEDVKFGKKYYVYSEDQVEARCIVNPGFMEQFMNDEFSLAITNKKLKMELDNQNK
jgi:hypothetical protein